MNILNSIYDSNINELDNYYTNHKSTSLEVILALSFYLTEKNEKSLQTLYTVSQAFNSYIDNFNKFTYFVRTFVGFDLDFYEKMQNVPLMKRFLETHHDSMLERIDFYNKKIQDGTNINSAITIDTLQSFTKIVKSVQASRRQEDITDISQSLSYFEDMRICDIKNFQNRATMNALEEDLLLNVYNCFKFKKLPLTDIDIYIDKTREIRNDFINNSVKQDNTFSPLFACLHKDIVSALTNIDNQHKNLNDFTFENLWTDINKLNLSNISSANFEVIDLPYELKHTFNDKKVKQGIYVLMQDGEIALGERNTLNFTIHEVRHIDLANGKDVMAAGTILFSEDMTRILAINPGSGHYKPSVISCIPMKVALITSGFDTSGLVICDLDWNVSKSITYHINPKQISDNIIGLRQAVDSNNKKHIQYKV